MVEKEKKELTPEEQVRKDRIRLRLFALLIILDILLIGYLVFEMIMIFSINSNKNSSSNIGVIIDTLKLLR